jgi:type VI secretion system protein ImpK
MREAIVNLVYPVIMQGLQLRERVDSGAQPDIEQEQSTLKGMLGIGSQVQWAAAGGQMIEADPGASIRMPPRPVFHYALVCWLDEIFSDESAFGKQWTDRTLEQALYGTRQRAWKFPEQARAALNRSSTDDLEVFYLCVMLGFRGDWLDDLKALNGWIDAVEARMAQGRPDDWPGRPPERETPNSAPPRHARERLQRMLSIAVVVVLLLIPAATFFLVMKLGEK